MNTRLMSISHQDSGAAGASGASRPPGLWTLLPRQAHSLHGATLPRWLHVESGQVWLTQVLAAGQAEDCWLQAGQSRLLPAGTAWVLEAWPQASLTLRLQAPVAGTALARQAAGRRSGRWGERWRAARAWAAPQSVHELHPTAAGTVP